MKSPSHPHFSPLLTTPLCWHVVLACGVCVVMDSTTDSPLLAILFTCKGFSFIVAFETYDTNLLMC